MSELAAAEDRAPVRAPTAKAVPPPVEPVLDRWAVRAAFVGLVGLLVIAAVMMAPRWQPWLLVVVATASVGVVVVVMVGVRTNRRRELVALLTTQLQVRTLFPLRITRVRWRNLWAAAPARMTLRYPLRVRHATEPDLLAAQLARTCSELLGLRYVPRRHTSRGHLTLAREPAEVRETTELDEIRERIREVVRQLLGKDAVVGGFTTNPGGSEITAFTVRHSAGVKLANQLFQIRVTRIMSAMLPGKWRAHFDLETDEARFRLRPPLPTFIARPLLPCEPGTPAYFELPQAVDEDGTMQVWDISGVMAHCLKVGRTRTGKTVSLIGDAVEAARRGFRVLVVDPKRVEFLGMRDWPNVEVVATTVQDQIAIIYLALELMNERYRLVEEEGARESDFDRVLLIIDEYRQFYANVKGWWASIKVTGMPTECPVFEWVGSLLRMAGACGIHVDLGTQRPDADFLKGEVRDNFSARMSTGRLSPDGAQMMYDTQHIGTTVPLNVRGRATMIGIDDAPREVQVYYTPDPRRATSAADLQLLEAFKPDRVTHPRRRVVLGDADAARAALAESAEDGDGKRPKKTQPTADEWLELLNAQLVLWTAAADAAGLPGQDSEQGTAEDDDEPLGEEDLYADYEPAETVRARRIRPDMLLQVDPDRWVCVTAVDTTTPDTATEDHAELQLVAWRDDDDNEGMQEVGSFELVDIRRPSIAGDPSR